MLSLNRYSRNCFCWELEIFANLDSVTTIGHDVRSSENVVCPLVVIENILMSPQSLFRMSTE